ncbi:MAG TPA: alpha/beta hydrolase [Chitinophagaceae bacterium]|nr:alpha/beta hydrolase [Chitinophagaceae bacterium]
MNKTLFLLLSLLAGVVVSAQQTIIPLYDGPAPGSENWNWDEKTFFAPAPMNANITYNISRPTLTVFSPDTTNGTAIIICPGGGFCVVNTEYEGTRVAKELNKKGVTVFLLKYRVAHSLTDDPWSEMINSLKDRATHRQKTAAIGKLAYEDAKKAITYLRQYASAFNIDPKRIGVVGFSAGAALAMNLAVDDTADIRPDFAGFICSGSMPEKKPQVGSPPVFIACATDDILASPAYSVNLYTMWISSGLSAELHIYEKGGHGLRTGNSYTWITRFEEWLGQLGFIKTNQ